MFVEDSLTKLHREHPRNGYPGLRRPSPIQQSPPVGLDLPVKAAMSLRPRDLKSNGLFGAMRWRGLYRRFIVVENYAEELVVSSTAVPCSVIVRRPAWLSRTVMPRGGKERLDFGQIARMRAINFRRTRPESGCAVPVKGVLRQ